MSRKMGYPRNEAARRDRILSHEVIHGVARSPKSQNDQLANDPHVANVAPSIALTGTAISGGVLEAAVVTGSETVIITLTGDVWAPDLGADNPNTTALLAAITGDGGAAGFTAEVALVHGNLARTSDTVLTLTLPASASYSIVADETVTVAPPQGSLRRGIVPAVATFDVSTIAVVLSGTMVAGGVTEAQMAAGGETLILTLTGPPSIWDATVGADNAVTTALLAGITGDDDYATIAALTDFEDVARTSDSVVTITYPVGTGYSIAADEDVSVAVPASAVSTGVAPAVPAVVVITEGA